MAGACSKDTSAEWGMQRVELGKILSLESSISGLGAGPGGFCRAFPTRVWSRGTRRAASRMCPAREGHRAAMSAPRAAAQLLLMQALLAYSFRPLLRGRG